MQASLCKRKTADCRPGLRYLKMQIADFRHTSTYIHHQVLIVHRLTQASFIVTEMKVQYPGNTNCALVHLNIIPVSLFRLPCLWQALNPGGLLGSIFAGYVPLASQNPYPIIVYSVANYRPHLSHFWANVIFAIPT